MAEHASDRHADNLGPEVAKLVLLERLREIASSFFDQQYAMWPDACSLAEARATDFAQAVCDEMDESMVLHPAAETLRRAFTKIFFVFTDHEDTSQTAQDEHVLELIVMIMREHEADPNLQAIAGHLDMRANNLCLCRAQLHEAGALEGMTIAQQFEYVMLYAPLMLDPQAQEPTDVGIFYSF